MNKISLLAIATALMLTGCATVKTIDLSEATSTWQPALYTITLNNGSEFNVQDVLVQGDSTSWINPGTGEKAGAPTTQVKTISCERSALQARTVAPAAFNPMVCSKAPLRSTTTTPAFAEINKLALKKKAIVTLADNQTLNVYRLQVTADSTSWWLKGQWETSPTSEIREIRFVSRGKGALQAVGLGLLVGASVGAAIGYSEGDDPPCPPPPSCELAGFPGALACGLGLLVHGLSSCHQMSAEDKAADSGLMGGLVGGLIGVLVGSRRKSKDIYRFKVFAPKPPAVASYVQQHRTPQK